MKPKVVVCTPTRNRAKFLRQTLYSLCDQGLERDEYVVAVSDNASDDDTRDVVAAFSTQLNIVYHRNDRDVGMRRNWEIVLGLCDAPFVAWLPDDDLLSPGHLGRAIRAASSNPGTALVSSLAIVQPHPGAPHSCVHGMFLSASGKTAYDLVYVWDLAEWLALALVDTPLSLIGSVFEADAFRRSSLWRRYEFWADRLLLAEMGLYGDVLSLPWVGGYYRVGTHQASSQVSQNFNHEFRAITQDVLRLAESRGIGLAEFWVEFLARTEAIQRPYYLGLLKRALPSSMYKGIRDGAARKAGRGRLAALLFEHPGLELRARRAARGLFETRASA